MSSRSSFLLILVTFTISTLSSPLYNLFSLYSNLSLHLYPTLHPLFHFSFTFSHLLSASLFLYLTIYLSLLHNSSFNLRLLGRWLTSHLAHRTTPNLWLTRVSTVRSAFTFYRMNDNFQATLMEAISLLLQSSWFVYNSCIFHFNFLFLFLAISFPSFIFSVLTFSLLKNITPSTLCTIYCYWY